MSSRAEDLFEEIMLNKHSIEPWFDSKIAAEWLEDEFLDFKSSDVIDKPSHNKQLRDTLSKAISAFANTEGGVLILGIEAYSVNGSRDLVQKYKPLKDCIAALDQFRGLKGHLSTPALSGMRCEPIVTGPNNEGYLIIYVPQGDHRPYRAEHDKAYYQRTIDSSIVMNHEVLRGMFYARQNPSLEVKHHWRLDNTYQPNSITISSEIKNIGTATAEDVSIHLSIFPLGRFIPSYQCTEIRTPYEDTDVGFVPDKYMKHTQVLSKVNIHPNQIVESPLQIVFDHSDRDRSALEKARHEGITIFSRFYYRNSDQKPLRIHIDSRRLHNNGETGDF